jgi:hypothetical protein
MNVGQWPARRIVGISLLWGFAIMAAVLIRPLLSVWQIPSQGSGGVGFVVTSQGLIESFFGIAAPPAVLIAVWIVKGRHRLVDATKVVLSVVFTFAAVLAVFIAWAVWYFRSTFENTR